MLLEVGEAAGLLLAKVGEARLLVEVGSPLAVEGNLLAVAGNLLQDGAADLQQDGVLPREEVRLLAVEEVLRVVILALVILDLKTSPRNTGAVGNWGLANMACARKTVTGV